MRRRLSEVLLPAIASLAFCMVSPGFCPCALADANGALPVEAASLDGGIGGGFFTRDAILGNPGLDNRGLENPGLKNPGLRNPALANPAMANPGARLPAPVAPPGMTPQAMAAVTGPDLCDPAVSGASLDHHLPPGLLHAIAAVESGRLNPQTGAVTPWPWTIDADGTGYMYPTEQAAEQAAAGFEAAGVTSLDIGCLQVNLAQHPDAFPNLAAAFDPATNADYAARFLSGLEQKFGNWPQAVAAYHSQTPSLGGPYAARVYAQWQGAPATGEGGGEGAGQGFPGAGQMALAAAHPTPSGPATAAPMPVLPQTAYAMASLIAPPRVIMRPNQGLMGRSLASYRAAPVAIATAILPQG